MVSTVYRALKPPTKVVEYEFSYSRSTGKMRFRHQEQEWLCKSIVGEAWCRYADGEVGNLSLVCQLALDDEGNATLWKPEGELIMALRVEGVIPSTLAKKEWEDFPQGRHSKRWRLCLNRSKKTWRIRDDDVDSEKIWNVNSYRGVIKIRWMDSGPHIHAEQPAWIDAKGVVQFNG